MASSKKIILLLLSFFVLGFILFLSKTSLAADTTPVYCTITNCGASEKVECGEKYRRYCESCCDEDGGDCEPCCPCCTQYRCRGSWTQYRASSEDCEPTIERRVCKSVCSGDGSECCSCGGCKIECGVWESSEKVGASETCEICKSWQKAVKNSCENPDSINWCESRPECKCCGECIDKPENPEYCMSPSCSVKAEANNVYLPVKLDWKDVRGFWSGAWSGGGSTIQNYAGCQEGYIDFCWEEAKALNPGWSCQGEITDEYLVCLRRETKENCQDLLQEDEACKENCPVLEEGGDECYKPGEFVNYYQIEIWGGSESLIDCTTLQPIDRYSDFLEASEFFAPCLCFYKSGWTYNWHVRGCCDDQESTCGPWSDTWTFHTNPAPEPTSPYDPDWAGSGKAENVSATTSLEWCGIADTKEYPTETECRAAWAEIGAQYYWDYQYNTCREYSHQLLLYLIESGNKVCHPYATEPGEKECNPELLKPFSPGSTPNSAYHPTEFSNQIYRLFTKNFTYFWQAATCKDDHAGNCTEFGQEWKFSLANLDFSLTQVVSPGNDPEGGKPVGFPVNIQWLASLGTMSYWYEIYEKGSAVPKITGTTTQPGIILDSPRLDLNTIYKWRVKSCWSYYAEADRCENSWSNFFYFKTTGQPPKLISPENNAAELVIPVEFQWENIGGAKSYVFKINGEEKIVERRTEINLDYPELLQQESYSWQVKTCAKANGQLCGNWSDEYYFTTFKLGTPVNLWPKNGSIISTTDTHGFSWDEVLGAEYKYYEFKIQYKKASPEENRPVCLEGEGGFTTKIIPKNSLYNQLKCNGEYEWQVRACLAANCEEPQSTGDWSALSTLTLVSKETTQEVSEEIIREVLKNTVYADIFAKMPEETSKRVAEIVSAKTLEILENYPEIDWLTQADTTPEVPRIILEQVLADGYTDHTEIANEVGKRVAKKVEELLKTMPDELLKRVTERLPEEILKISDPSEIPTMLETIIGEEWDKLSAEIISQASAMAEVPEGVLEAKLLEMKAEAINDTLGEVAKVIAGIPGQVEMRKGLVPCGRTSNNPDTDWDETERCQIKHLFILVYVIIDFFLWKVIPIILVLLTLASGAIFYFSLQAQNPEPLATVKSLWKAAGIGLAVVFLAWTAISLFLAIFDYQVGLFGPWWQI